jgi:hypothetical protein
MAAAVGSKVGFGLDHLDDLRMAVDEMCYCLIGDGGTAGDIVLTFFAVPDGLGVEGSITTSDKGVPRELPELSKRIFDALTTSYDCKLDGTSRWFTFTKRVIS